MNTQGPKSSPGEIAGALDNIDASFQALTSEIRLLVAAVLRGRGYEHEDRIVREVCTEFYDRERVKQIKAKLRNGKADYIDCWDIPFAEESGAFSDEELEIMRQARS